MSSCELLNNGLVGPFYLQDLDKLDLLLKEIDSKSEFKDLHVESSAVTDVFNDNNLQRKVKQFFGNELLLWRSNFFIKNEKSEATPWHHDKHFESGDIPIDFNDISSHFSILIAVTDMTSEKGMMEFVEGSHQHIESLNRDTRPFHKKPPEEHFVSIPQEVQPKVIQVSLKKGQFMLFHSGLLHRSLPFVSGERRVSMIGRLVKKGIKIPVDLAPTTSVTPFNR